MSNGIVQALWRYPVKSLLGEPLKRITLNERGVEGDRFFAISHSDGKLGSGKDTRRFKKTNNLFLMSAKTSDQGIVISFSDGIELTDKDVELNQKLSDVVGEEVSLTCEAEVSHFDAGPVHILTSRALMHLQAQGSELDIDERRFRPNVVIDFGADISDKE